MNDTLERIVEFVPGYDKKDEGWGIHGVDLRMVLKGPRGAVQFVLYTGWYQPHLRKTMGAQWPLPADVGYHSPEPRYDGQEPMAEACEYLDGAPCYYDGSGLRAEKVFDILTEKGSDGVWEYLEDEYKALFGAGR